MAELTTDSLVEEFETSTKIAQIFSGIFFGFVVLYLVFSNSTRLSFIQQASQEKRLAYCCNIGIAVGAISAFLSVFQITDLDDHFLPSQPNYTVDMSRPVEWILTCPLMQLTLVLMGGSRIPEYRRLLMPFLSALIVSLGTLSLFVKGIGKYLCYIGGLVTFVIMTYFNRLQVFEHSNGEEGFLRGESEFRKATLILILTWVPFPVWYSLSPEGFDVIDNVLLIQIGWMCLNLIAKGSSILYIQRSKDNYNARLKVNKLMKGTAVGQSQSASDDVFCRADASLGPCVAETFAYLGMADKSERFLKLLGEAKIYSLEQVEELTPAECEKKKLPHDLVSALQKRHRNWKLEVQDDAEKGIEKGETYYAKQNLESDPSALPGVKLDNAQMNLMNQQMYHMLMGGMNFDRFMDTTDDPRPVSNEDILGKLTTIEQRLQAVDDLEEKMNNGFKGLRSDVEKHAGKCQAAVDRGMLDICSSFNCVASANPTGTSPTTPSKVGLALSGMVDGAVASWAQKIMTESRSDSFTLQTRVAAVEEALAKIVENSADQLVERINVSVKSATDNCAQKMEHAFSEDRKRSEAATDSTIVKHAQVGVGILTNTLKEHVATLQDSQKKAEGKMKQQVETATSQMLDHSGRLLRNFELSLKADIQEQKTLTFSILEQAATAQVRTKECHETLQSLSHHIALSSTSATPSGSRRASADCGVQPQALAQQLLAPPQLSPTQPSRRASSNAGSRCSGSGQASASQLPTGGI